jgi:large subunit ribosomal protein L23
MKLSYIIKKPIITEKSLQDSQDFNRYTFEVIKPATKGQIKDSIEKLFKVKVISLQTTKISGKRRRASRYRRQIVKPDGKKAIVQLKAGQKIDLFETKE